MLDRNVKNIQNLGSFRSLKIQTALQQPTRQTLTNKQQPPPQPPLLLIPKTKRLRILQQLFPNLNKTTKTKTRGLIMA
jgi:hypothetical protein